VRRVRVVDVHHSVRLVVLALDSEIDDHSDHLKQRHDDDDDEHVRRERRGVDRTTTIEEATTLAGGEGVQGLTARSRKMRKARR
jgi:hypothetical protein